MTLEEKIKKTLSEKEKKILEVIADLLPLLTEIEREKVLSFGEGMAYVKKNSA